MLKLKLQYFGHLMWRTDSLEKTLMLGKIEGRRRRGRQRMRWLDGIVQTQWTWVWVNSKSWWQTGRPGMLQSMGLQRAAHDWATELNWFIVRTDAEAETSILWPLDVKNWLIGKDPDAGKEWRQEEKGTTEDKMVGWHHWLNGHEFEQALGVGDGQGSLEWFRTWGLKESDRTEWWNWTELNSLSSFVLLFTVIVSLKNIIWDLPS